MHALLSEEIAAILDVAERWGTVDRSHRKLAPRGSYEHLVWVLAVHVPPRPDRTRAHPARAGAAHTDREAAVAGPAGTETETDTDTGMRHISPAPVGSASRSWTWSPVSGSTTLVSVEETATRCGCATYGRLSVHNSKAEPDGRKIGEIGLHPRSI